MGFSLLKSHIRKLHLSYDMDHLRAVYRYLNTARDNTHLKVSSQSVETTNHPEDTCLMDMSSHQEEAEVVSHGLKENTCQVTCQMDDTVLMGVQWGQPAPLLLLGNLGSIQNIVLGQHTWLGDEVMDHSQALLRRQYPQDFTYHFIALLFYFGASLLEAATTAAAGVLVPGISNSTSSSSSIFTSGPCTLVLPEGNVVTFLDYRQYSINVAASVSIIYLITV
ncbi:UNVERIFIED_CONTAM: hypothetical protein FKN15_040742 [Acipenser sinensis]